METVVVSSRTESSWEDRSDGLESTIRLRLQRTEAASNSRSFLLLSLNLGSLVFKVLTFVELWYFLFLVADPGLLLVGDTLDVTTLSKDLVEFVPSLNDREQRRKVGLSGCIFTFSRRSGKKGGPVIKSAGLGGEEGSSTKESIASELGEEHEICREMGGVATRVCV